MKTPYVIIGASFGGAYDSETGFLKTGAYQQWVTFAG